MKRTLLALSVCLLPCLLHAQQPVKRDYRILHVNKKFVPDKGFRADNQFSRQAAGDPGRIQYDRDQYYLAQFDSLPKPAQQAQLKNAGVLLLDYFPNYAYYVYFEKQVSSGQLAALGIRTLVPLDESFRLSPGLFQNRIPAHARKGDAVALIITIFAAGDPAAAEKEIRKHATITAKNTPTVWEVTVPVNKLRQLAGIKQIKFIEPPEAEPQPEKEPEEAPVAEDIFSNDHGRSNYINSGYNGISYNGAGVNVMVRENGMYQGPDFQGRIIPGGDAPPGDPSSHATGVSMRLGSGGNAIQRDRSNAWGSNVLGISGQNLYTLYDDPAKKIRVVNMSYGWGPDAGYNSGSREHDNFIRTRPEAMLVYSSGNTGDVAPVGGKYDGIAGWGNITGMNKHAKNLLVISGTDYEDNFLDWTCKGPAYDGRVKPELTIEGGGGTSFAAPKVSGIFAILHEAYKTEQQAATAPSALIKAVLMNTADDIYNPGIDFKTGYGRPNVRRAFAAIRNGRFFSGSISNGEQAGFPINVPAGTSQVRVLLYWADYEAASGAAQALVNDLDLTVRDGGGNTTLPWVLDTTASAINLNMPPTRNTDHINNVEQVTIDNPAAGAYTLQINGFNIPQGPQDFYVVYEFLQDEVVMSYPLGGESFAPGQSEYIRWDAYGAPGTFNVSYSADNGATWNTIAANLAAEKRQYKWTVPNIAAKILVRVTRGAQTVSSAPVNVLPVPAGLRLDWVCGRNLQLVWNKVPQASQYEVFRLGAKYMELIGSTSDTLFIFNAADSAQGEWYAVRAIDANGTTGLRSNALSKAPGSFNCQSLLTGIAYDVRQQQVTFKGTVNAFGGTLTDVAFEYGPTTAYGSQQIISGSFTGTSFQPVVQTAAHNMRSGETWHFRLKGSLNGTMVYGSDQPFQPAPGYSMQFNGAETITVGPNDAVNGNKPRTIECWVRTSTYNADGGVITLAGGTGTTRGDFTLSTNGGDNLWKLALWNVTRSYTLPNNKGEWHHMAITYNPANTTAELYYDGTLFDTWNTGGALSTIAGNIRLGVRVNGGSFYYNGDVDEVRIWSTVRTAAQIRENMHHPLAGNETGLVYYLNFDNMTPETYELVNKKTITSTGSPVQITATYPFGAGTTTTGTEAAGSIAFGNNVQTTATYAAQAQRPVSFSRVQLTSAPFTGLPGSATRLADEYWIGHRFTTAGGALNMQLAFKSAADLATADETAPANVLLFTRQPYAGGNWVYKGGATAVDAQNDSVKLSGQTEYLQYVFAKDTNAAVLLPSDTLAMTDARAGAVSKSSAIQLSGYNLPAEITAAAPEGFELSLNNIDFTNSDSVLTIPTTAGRLSNLPLYVRFAPHQAGAFTGHMKLYAGAGTLDSVYLAQNAIPADAKAGKAMTFDGNGDYLEIQNFNWQPTEFTVEWWLKAGSTKDWNQQIGNGWGSFMVHADNAKKLNIGTANNTNSRMVINDAFADLGTWHHYAYTFRNGEAKVYRDGRLMDSKPASSYPAMMSTFRIGQPNTSTLHGDMEEFRIWSVARTQQQIRENMHLTLQGNEPGLKVYLQFQDAASGVTDLSDTAHLVRLFGNTVRTASTTPVAAGVAQTRNITTPGTVQFDQAGIQMQFGAGGTLPMGEVVASRLQAAPGSDLTPPAADSTYWVIHNYGANGSFSALTSITLAGTQQQANEPSVYSLFKRAFNAEGNTWALAGRTASATDSSIIFTADSTLLSTTAQLAVNKVSGTLGADSLAGQAFTFPGSGASLKVTGLNIARTNFTVEWWIKPYSATSWNQQVGNGWGSFLAHANSTGTLSIGVANNTNSRIEVPGVFTLNTWRHIAFTFDNGVAKTYVDGLLAGTKTTSSLPSAAFQEFIVSNAGGNVHGELDEFRIWSTTRTEQEIQEHMHLTLTGRETGLEAYLQGQGSPTAAYLAEASANSRTVTVTGNIQRNASAAPVGKGTSQTLAITAPGYHHFDETGLSLEYTASAAYPRGNVVISRLNNLPYGVVQDSTLFAQQYWIVRNYGDAGDSTVTNVALHQAQDSTANTFLDLRAFNAEGAWAGHIAGRYDAGRLVFGTASAAVKNSQFIFRRSANAAPAFTVPEGATAYRNATCGFDAAPAITGYPTTTSDDSGLPPQVQYRDTLATPSQLKRVWTVTDQMGLSASAVQLIQIKDSTAPVITNVAAVSHCYGNTGEYTVPAATAGDNCGISSIRYTVSGATARSGNGGNASGSFNTGLSVITWTVTDSSGNTGNWQTAVRINAPMSAAIADVYAVNPGGEANTIYLGYGPQSLTLTASAQGGTAPYTYSWQQGGGNAAAQVSPATAGTHTYTVTITDAAGCSTTATHTVTVVDVRCGNGDIIVCHKGKTTVCVPPADVADHISHGCKLGSCNGATSALLQKGSLESMAVQVLPNPSTTEFVLKVTAPLPQTLTVRVFDAQGQLVTELRKPAGEQIRFGQSLKAGLYYVEISQGVIRKTVKVIKL